MSYKHKVTIVGDYPELKDILKKNAYEIILSENLSEALNFTEKEPSDLLLLDKNRITDLKRFLSNQSKMTSLGHVITGIAHEIRSPLSVINISLNNLKMLLSGEQDKKKVKKVIEVIQATSNKIESVIKKVLGFTKAWEPKRALNDINQTIEEILSLMSVTLRKKEISVEKFLAKNLPLYSLDIYLFQEMILNMIINAIDAMEYIKEGKKLEITTALEKNKIFINISDSGPGIPPHIQEKILDTFFTTKEDNIGVGLSIGNKIITDHEGSLKVGKSKWGGAKFTMVLPLVKGKPK